MEEAPPRALGRNAGRYAAGGVRSLSSWGKITRESGGEGGLLPGRAETRKEVKTGMNRTLQTEGDSKK